MILPSIYGHKPQLVYDDVLHLCEIGVSCFHFDIFDESVDKQPYSGLQDIAFFEELFDKYSIKKNIHIVSRYPQKYFPLILEKKIEEVILHPGLLDKSEISKYILYLQNHGIQVGLSLYEDFCEYINLPLDFIHVCNYDYFHGQKLSDKQVSNKLSILNRTNKPILVDGGVCCENIALYKTSGASSFVCGRSIFDHNPIESYLQLMNLIQ